jgi:hypothetical protein
MNQEKKEYLNILKIGSISILSIFFYIAAISIFTFFHFHLSHDMFTINSWITENKWGILFLIKFLVWGVVIYWKSTTQPTAGLFRRFRVFFFGSFDSFFAGLLNIFAIIFFIYYEGVDVFNFDFRIFILMSFFYISDVVVFLLFEATEMKKAYLLTLIGVLSVFNGLYLHVVELFDGSFLMCYLLAFGAGLFVVFSKRVHKSMIFSIGVFGLALFVGLSYSPFKSNQYLVELSSSKLNTVILFLSLAVANYFFISLRSSRLSRLNERIEEKEYL